jgi:hypothetical protein
MLFVPLHEMGGEVSRSVREMVEEIEAVEILGGGDERAVFIRGIDDECGFEGDKSPGLGNGGES